jgi:D-glycero-D-manno-heptose 1,7-bisphosphate phosphatase
LKREFPVPGVRRWIAPQSRNSGKRPAVFLDRDGVLIEDTGYLCRTEELRFIPGSAEAVARLNQAGFVVVLVTNQSGVGRGYYGWSDFEAVQAALISHLAATGAWLDGWWACAYHEDGTGEYRVANHPFRKPNPGMIEDAVTELDLDLARSWMVGDRASDLEAGLRAGLRVVHVGTGRDADAVESPSCRDLAAATDLILKQA